MHPTHGRVEGKKLSDLEDFLLNKAPTALATQERFTIFQKEIQKRVADNVTLASIPCGLMGDLLTLNHSESVTLVGIDIDPASLKDAAELAYQKDFPA